MPMWILSWIIWQINLFEGVPSVIPAKYIHKVNTTILGKDEGNKGKFGGDTF